jgi:hypothetical protein
MFECARCVSFLFRRGLLSRRCCFDNKHIILNCIAPYIIQNCIVGYITTSFLNENVLGCGLGEFSCANSFDRPSLGLCNSE